jgi:hypothetical protein
MSADTHALAFAFRSHEVLREGPQQGRTRGKHALERPAYVQPTFLRRNVDASPPFPGSISGFVGGRY